MALDDANVLAANDANRPAAIPQPTWSGRSLLLAAAVLASLAALATFVDFSLARWVRDVDLPRDLERFVRLCEAFAFGGTVTVIIIAAGLLDPRRWYVVGRLVIVVFGAGLVANSAKLLVARERPYFAALDEASAIGTFVGWLPALYREGLPTKYGHALQSFPSGHAATATGLAIGLSLMYPSGRWLFVMLAAMACYQRIDAGAHYLSDVLAGAAIACLVGGLYQCVVLRRAQGPSASTVVDGR